MHAGEGTVGAAGEKGHKCRIPQTPRPGPGSSGHHELWFNPKPLENLLFPKSGIFRVTLSRMNVVLMPLPGWPGDGFVRLVHRTPQGSLPPCPGCRAALLSWGAGGHCSRAPTHLPERAQHLVEAPAPHPGSPPRGPGAVGRGQEVSSHVCRVVWGRAAQGLHPGSRGQLAVGAGSLRGDTHPPRGCCLRWVQLGHFRPPPGDHELWGWAVASRAHAESLLGGRIPWTWR